MGRLPTFTVMDVAVEASWVTACRLKPFLMMFGLGFEIGLKNGKIFRLCLAILKTV